MTQDQIVARRNAINALIDSAGATFLAIEFKKLDGELRTIQVQLPKAKFEVVGEAASESRQQAVATRKANNPHLRNLWDVAKAAFRSVNLDTVLAVTVRGTRYEVGQIELVALAA